MSITFRELPDGYGVRAEVDLMEEARKRICRKIEIDGEKALELALAEVGYVKERTCKMYRDEHGVWHCAACERGADTITGSSGTLDSWNDSWAPNYCPSCGAKVVDDG